MLKRFKSLIFLATLLFIASQNASVYSESPMRLQDHLQAAQGYMDSQQWNYASFEWRSALDQDPNNLDATLGLSEALEKSGLLKDSISVLEDARTHLHRKPLDLALATSYKSVGEYQKAKDVYLDVLQLLPYDPDAYGGLVSVFKALKLSDQRNLLPMLRVKADFSKDQIKHLMQKARYSDALDYYDIVYDFYKQPGWLNDKAMAQLLSGQRENAGQTLLPLANKVEVWQIQANAAIVLLSLGRTFEAQQQMEKAIGLSVSNTEKALLYNNLGYIYETGHKRTKARFAYERAIEIKPDFTKAQMNLGAVYQLDRDFEKAIALYQSLLGRLPNNADAWNQLGFSYELAHKPKLAVNAYKKAVAFNPKLEEAYYNLGSLYKKMNKMNESADAYKQMTNLEFAQIEASRKASPSGEVADKPTLFNYIDLFFAQKQVL